MSSGGSWQLSEQTPKRGKEEETSVPFETWSLQSPIATSAVFCSSEVSCKARPTVKGRRLGSVLEGGTSGDLQTYSKSHTPTLSVDEIYAGTERGQDILGRGNEVCKGPGAGGAPWLVSKEERKRARRCGGGDVT